MNDNGPTEADIDRVFADTERKLQAIERDSHQKPPPPPLVPDPDYGKPHDASKWEWASYAVVALFAVFWAWASFRSR